MRTGTANNTGTQMDATVFQDAPARKIIPTMIAPTHMVTDILGSSIISTQILNPAPSTGSTPFKERIRAGFFAKYHAVNNTNPYFAISEG